MEWSKLDTSFKKFKSYEQFLKAQGNYSDRVQNFLIFKSIVSSFDVSIYTSGIDKLKYHDNKRVILIPNHRSYFDPVILLNVLTLNGFKHIKVAADELLATTPLGGLYERNGAVYIREKFDDPEYREKINKQLRQYADEGHWMSFYLEANISRSGKQLFPKRGLIKALTEDKPCVIYPINVSYERAFDDVLFFEKMKNTDNMKIPVAIYQFLYVSKSFVSPNKIGNVTFSVGDPIYTEPGIDPFDLSLKISRNIMNVNVVRGTDILSTIILDRGEDKLKLSDLQEDVKWLRNELEIRGFTVFDFNIKDISKVFNHILTIKNGFVHVKSRDLLYYYRNRLSHTLKDLVTLPPLLKYEAFNDKYKEQPYNERLTKLAVSVFEPVVFMYNSIAEQIREGETDIKNIHKSLNDNPNYCYESVEKCLEVLKENKIIEVNKKTIKLIRK